MSRILLILLSLVLIAFFVGCGTQEDAESELQGEQTQSQEESAASASKTSRVPQTATILAGTRLEVRLSESLGSAQNQSGDSFKSVLDKGLEANGSIVVPQGSTVIGKLSDVRQSGRARGLAFMSLTLTELRTDDDSYPIQTETLSFEAESSKKTDAAKIGAGAGIGAVVGAIAGGKKGAAIGAAVGGGAGTATVVATRGEELEFAAERLLYFTLTEDLRVKVP